MIKLICLDLDGTLMSTDHLTVSEENKKALKMAHDRGVKIAISTGRTLAIMGDVCEQVPEVDYVIYSNGAAVLDRKTNENIYTSYMSLELSKGLLEYLEDKPCFYEIYSHGKSYCQRDKGDVFDGGVLPQAFIDEVIKNMVVVENAVEELGDKEIEKMSVFSLDDALYNEIKEHLEGIDELYTTSSISYNIDMTKRGVDKGTAVDGMCKKLGFEPSEVMAFGDAGNDCPMLEYAEYSYAMANGSDECKAAAKFETKSNAEDGVAFAINEYFSKIEK